MFTYSFLMGFLSGIVASWIISILVAAWLCWPKLSAPIADDGDHHDVQDQMRVVAHTASKAPVERA
jgi:hypothetical protein